MEYTTFQVIDGIVSLGDNGEHERIFLLSMVVSIEVDWTRASGVIEFVLTNGGRASVKFVEHDGGQECADAISDVFAAWREAGDVVLRTVRS